MDILEYEGMMYDVGVTDDGLAPRILIDRTLIDVRDLTNEIPQAGSATSKRKKSPVPMIRFRACGPIIDPLGGGTLRASLDITDRVVPRSSYQGAFR